MHQALHGTRILDMAWIGPGPFCATLLGDLGAEVIKIHEPDPGRGSGMVKFAFPAESPGFPGMRNMKTMGIDLKTDAGREIFYELAKTADVVMEGYRPGVVTRLGVDYDAIREINPRIVYASLSGYGQEGPYREVVGHDINYISIGGLLGMTGAIDGGPVPPGTLIADFAAGGMGAAVGILAALTARHTTGRGQYVDVSLADGIVEMLYIWLVPLMMFGLQNKRGDTIFTGHYPWYNVYETKDGGYISIAALEPHFYRNLCELLGREDFIGHQFAEGEKRAEMAAFFTQTFLTRDRDEWVEILRSKDTCVAPVYSLDEVVKDPQLIARDMIRELPHPTLGTVKQVGSMLKLSDSPFQVRNWCTEFGQHTDELLGELGYDPERIGALRQAEVIG